MAEQPQTTALRLLDLSNVRYTLLAGGRLTKDKIRLHHDPTLRPRLLPWQRESIASYCQDLRQQGARVVNRPLYRYLRNDLEGGLRLETGSTCYEEYLGCSLAYPEWAEEFGFEATADALSVAGVTEVSGLLLVGRRSQQVAEYPGFYHVEPAGHVHPPADPTEAVVREAREELGLLESEIEELECLGLVRSNRHRCVDIVYHLSSAVAAEELLSRRPRDAWEHSELLLVDPAPGPLADWLLDNYPRTTDPGHGALVLEGLRRHGSDWLASLWERIDEL